MQTTSASRPYVCFIESPATVMTNGCWRARRLYRRFTAAGVSLPGTRRGEPCAEFRSERAHRAPCSPPEPGTRHGATASQGSDSPWFNHRAARRESPCLCPPSCSSSPRQAARCGSWRRCNTVILRRAPGIVSRVSWTLWLDHSGPLETTQVRLHADLYLNELALVRPRPGSAGARPLRYTAAPVPAIWRNCSR